MGGINQGIGRRGWRDRDPARQTRWRPQRRGTALETREILKKVPLFEGLTEEELSALLTIVHPREYPCRVPLFHEGDPGEEFMIVVEGSVKVEVLNPEGKELTLTILKPYQFLGELALLDDLPRSASVVAMEKTRVLVIHKQDFRRMLLAHPSMFFPILQALSRRIRALTEDLSSLAFLDAYSRVARKVLHLAEQLGVPGGGQNSDRVEIRQPITHQELANLVGTTRETVTKILNEMKDQGLVSIERRRITVLRKRELLRALM